MGLGKKVDRYNRSISINMFFSIDNDLSIGFPISDLIDWSGREVCYLYSNNISWIAATYSEIEVGLILDKCFDVPDLHFRVEEIEVSGEMGWR